MTPTEIGERVVALLGEPAAHAVEYGVVTVDVPPQRWVDALQAAKTTPGLDLGFFDWLGAVDLLDEGFAVVVHLWSVEHRHHLLLRTRVPRDRPQLPTATGVFAGANWHEREAFEMFGVIFDGHPHLVPLLLPDGFEGHPLRKDFVLAARVAKPWPGAKEPGESDAAPGGRRKMLPPGVPEPGAWGPAPADAGDRPARPARPARAERPPRGQRPPESVS